MRLLGSAVFVAIGISGQGEAVAQLPQHFGGYGGMDHGSTQCPDYVVGIHGYVGTGGEGGTVVTQLGFTCANGQHELGTFGPPNGIYFEIDCNPGDAANGVGGRSGKYLDAVGLWCRDSRGNAYVAPVTAGPYFGVAGGGGGSSFNSTCGMQGRIPLIGVRIWSGANVDGLTLICTPTIDATWLGQDNADQGHRLWTWNTLNHPEDGPFCMTVRFTNENGQWKMYVDKLKAPIGVLYELQKDQIGFATVNGDHATLTLPVHGSGYGQDINMTLTISTDATTSPPGVPPQSGVPHNGNELDMVGQGQSGGVTFWAAFRGTINAWPGSPSAGASCP